MLKVYLLRHGETAWNADGNRYCGRTDLSLTDKGVEQANIVRRSLKDHSFDLIYASPLKRAVQTAKIVSGQNDIITDGRLTEVDFGSWEGKTKKQFISENPAFWEDWLKDPTYTQAGGNGEMGSNVIYRVDSFFQSLSKDGEKNIMIVGHNGINRLYLSYKLGMPLKNYRKFSLANVSIIKFILDETNELQLEALTHN